MSTGSFAAERGRRFYLARHPRRCGTCAKGRHCRLSTARLDIGHARE
ncbi:MULTISPECIES: hypothetical protein [unclassified Sphingobium]